MSLVIRIQQYCSSKEINTPMWFSFQTFKPGKKKNFTTAFSPDKGTGGMWEFHEFLFLILQEEQSIQVSGLSSKTALKCVPTVNFRNEPENFVQVTSGIFSKATFLYTFRL